jgi:hypothetical protein
MSRRSLWPREHGAYFQLVIPLITAYLLCAPNPAMVVLTVAAGLAFFANEPLLVVLGHRGRRLREEAGDRARLRLAILVPAASALAVLGLARAPWSAVAVAAVVAVPVIAVFALAWRRAEHTCAGELVAAIALTGAAAPVQIAGGAAPRVALAIWLGWSLGFAATVLAVRRVIARNKRRPARSDRIAGWTLAPALVVAAVACAAIGARLPGIAIAAPLAALAAVLVIAHPAATRLRAIGVAIVVAAAGSGAVAVLALTR